MNTDAPIFVLGWQRSGTTLLQSILGANSEIAAPPELYYVGRILNRQHHWPDLEVDDQLRLLLHELVNPRIDTLSNAGFDEHRLFERLAPRPRTHREVFKATMEDFAERAGKPRWSEKSPGQRASVILRLFPEARLVHIVRHPLDAIASALDTSWNQDPLLVLAERWRRLTLEVLTTAARVSDQYLRVRYEDLTRDPMPVIKRVCEHVGVPWEPEMISDISRRGSAVSPVAGAMQAPALEEVRAARARREELSILQRFAAWSIVDHVAARLGYDGPRFGGAAARRLALLAMRGERRARNDWVRRVEMAHADSAAAAQLVDDHYQSRRITP